MTFKNKSTDNCQDNPYIDESAKSRKIKEVHFRISQKSLEKWDDFRKTRLGNMSRTALIMNAVEIYMLIMKRQLENSDTGSQALKTQLDSISRLLNKNLSLLKEDHINIENKMKSFLKNETYSYKEVSEKILEILDKWGKIPIEIIIENLPYPDSLIYIALKKLKAYKKVKVSNGLWELYNRRENFNKKKS